MPALVDTTIRLLGQEPLAGVMPAAGQPAPGGAGGALGALGGGRPPAEQLRLAEILDSAGFAYLEVSGGGCFDSAVKRGVESPWERIRAIRARCSPPPPPGAAGRAAGR